MTVINSNSSALRAQNGTRMSNMQLQTAMARLSSGKRINSASDDAAGLAISNSMTSQISGMNQAVRNANDGISLAQTADGALEEVTNMLQRIRELAVQSASGTYSDPDRANMQTEVTALKSQVSDILTKTTFNNTSLFDTTTTGTTATQINIQVGANASEQVGVSKVLLKAVADLANATTGMDVSSTTNATTALGTASTAGSIDYALAAVATGRASLGASRAG